MDGRKVMITYETFTHKGKEYRFRVGRDEPKLEKFQLHGSDYYKEKLKSLGWVNFLTFIPLVVLGIIYFAYIGSDKPREALNWLAILAFPYGMLIYKIMEKAGEASAVLADLKEKAENEDYMEAYKAWQGSKTDRKEQDEKLKAWIKSNNAQSIK